MNAKPIELAKDPDLRGAIAALRRAELQAERIAKQTGTRLINVPALAEDKDDSRAEPQAGAR